MKNETGRVPVLCVVGKSNSGKTTLLEKLLPVMKDHGYRVGTIKHDAHQFEIDHPGKDTYRHFHAGAEQVLITSPAKLAIVKRQQSERPLEELVNVYCHELDLVITEGFKRSTMPKIEVIRAARSTEQICGPVNQLIARVTDVAFDDDVPCFALDEIEKIAYFIIGYFFGALET